MKAILLPLLALVVAGSLAKADSLDYKYTWHIDGVVLPDDGVQLPSMEIAFLAGNDCISGKRRSTIIMRRTPTSNFCMCGSRSVRAAQTT